jgi:hypothetical protein
VNAPGSTTANDSNSNPTTTILPTDSSEDQTLDFGYVAVGVNPGFQVMKMVNKTTINAGEPVTYTYTVKNTGATTLTDIELIDDNSTPNFPGDDFIVVTGLILAPGTQQSFTLTKFVPVTVCIPVNNVPTASGTLIVQQLPNLDWQVIFRQSLNIVDIPMAPTPRRIGRTVTLRELHRQRQGGDFGLRTAPEPRCSMCTSTTSAASGRYPSGYGSLGARVETAAWLPVRRQTSRVSRRR